MKFMQYELNSAEIGVSVFAIGMSIAFALA